MREKGREVKKERQDREREREKQKQIPAKYCPPPAQEALRSCIPHAKHNGAVKMALCFCA